MRHHVLQSALVATLLAAATACAPAVDPAATHAYPTVGRITVYDDALRAIVAPDARIERIAEGFTWSEGPLWMQDGHYLLFNDVPGNTMYRWSSRDGLAVFLKPSGYGGAELDGLREAGANGLDVEPAGTVLLADSGSRLIARLDPATKQKTTLAATYQGKRLNSPNDVIRHRNGSVYFTDPPYGLKGIDESPLKEQPVNGVYRLDRDGSVHLIEGGLRFPNGVALSPDEHTLYVANSDEKHPVWMAYRLDDRGDVLDRRVLADASDLVAAGASGAPDGLCLSSDGHLFASAPGGLLVMDANCKRLGLIETGSRVSNCAFGDDGHTLYLTSHSFVARVRVAVTGLGFQRPTGNRD
ncbi:SMP-30/gluconolactonase/LRE family protein [Lysobacter sp. S4-A87]|uniref:SMP-30/gluconolactonase/LRE family protein n=1 Tax=Lysobacter sp. S4-A87 TaxID=2925843 RepID=UPI001F53554F|nr:SMP-30/gluconolactonase/LRE family protein [Lysobacter sp. S4-A87]UNK48754.1 SMP-30/gluconolactonase/LRE family protein [Lysobacter sp. S4-A87]